jgi:hypothetical protein
MKKFLKRVFVDWWLNKQLELGKIEREKNKLLDNSRIIPPLENKRTEEDVIREYKSKKREKRRNIFVGVLVVFFSYLLLASTNTNDDNSNSSPYPVIEEDLTNWIPNGFKSWSEDSNVAWRWLEDTEYKCDRGDACWGMMVIARDGCKNSLYGEISILDKSNVQISYTNDSLSSTFPMQENRLVFTTYEDSAHSARLSKISCY